MNRGDITKRSIPKVTLRSHWADGLNPPAQCMRGISLLPPTLSTRWMIAARMEDFSQFTAEIAESAEEDIIDVCLLLQVNESKPFPVGLDDRRHMIKMALATKARESAEPWNSQHVSPQLSPL